MVYLILPVFNRIKHTKQFIDDLLKQHDQDFHLILVDDGSADGSAEWVSARLGKKVTILRGKGKWWWGGSLHQAYLFLSKRQTEKGDYGPVEDIQLIINHILAHWFQKNLSNKS